MTEPAPGLILLKVFVPGHPSVKGNLVGYKMGNRVRLVERSGETQRAWSAMVRDRADQARWRAGPHPGAVSCAIDFVLPRRKSAPKTRTDPHTRKPDVDKLARAVLDALTGVTWLDDAQVVDLRVTKREAGRDEGPGAYLMVVAL